MSDCNFNPTTENGEHEEFAAENVAQMLWELEEILEDHFGRATKEETYKGIPKKTSNSNSLLHEYYLHILNMFRPSEEQLTMASLIPVSPLEETELITIFTEEDLLKLVQLLRHSKEIAINTYYECYADQELISILAISTDTTDYLIDARNLRSDICLLSEICISPNIVKIMYENVNVQSSLKESLDLYCINVFDVARASTALGDPRHTFMNRLRLEYASARTKLRQLTKLADICLSTFDRAKLDVFRYTSHYLIYFYRECKNRLIARHPEQLKYVIMKCSEDCQRVVCKSDTRDSLHRELRARHDCELHVLRKCLEWRERKANACKMHPAEVLRRAEFNNIICNLPQSVEELKLVAPIFGASRYVQEMLKILKEAKAETQRKYGVLIRSNWSMFQTVENTRISREPPEYHEKKRKAEDTISASKSSIKNKKPKISLEPSVYPVESRLLPKREEESAQKVLVSREIVKDTTPKVSVDAETRSCQLKSNEELIEEEFRDSESSRVSIEHRESSNSSVLMQEKILTSLEIEKDKSSKVSIDSEVSILEMKKNEELIEEEFRNNETSRVFLEQREASNSSCYMQEKILMSLEIEKNSSSKVSIDSEDSSLQANRNEELIEDEEFRNNESSRVSIEHRESSNSSGLTKEILTSMETEKDKSSKVSIDSEVSSLQANKNKGLIEEEFRKNEFSRVSTDHRETFRYTSGLMKKQRRCLRYNEKTEENEEDTPKQDSSSSNSIIVSLNEIKMTLTKRQQEMLFRYVNTT